MKIWSSRGIGRKAEGQSANSPETTDPSFTTARIPCTAPRIAAKSERFPGYWNLNRSARSPKLPMLKLGEAHAGTSFVCKESRALDPQIREGSMEAEILHGMWSSCCTFFSPIRVFQEKCISTETDITSEGGNSKLFLQPLKIPLGKGKDGMVTACWQSWASSSKQRPPTKTATSFIHRGSWEPPSQGSWLPPSTPPAPSGRKWHHPYSEEIVCELWEGGLGARAGDAVRDVQRWERRKALQQQAQQHKPPPSRHREAGRTGSAAAAVQACPGALAVSGKPFGCHGWHQAATAGAGLGKAQGHRSLLWHVLNGQGVGNWMGHKRGTERGPPWSQKGETVPEEQPLPGLFSH